MATSPGQITGPVCVCEELRRRRLLWIQQAGDDHFSLMSDVGSKLYIDGKLVINNDGLHSVEERTGSATLKTGVHRIRVSYFQGPGNGVALILNVARPGEAWRPFDLDKFLPTPGHENWK